MRTQNCCTCVHTHTHTK